MKEGKKAEISIGLPSFYKKKEDMFKSITIFNKTLSTEQKISPRFEDLFKVKIINKIPCIYFLYNNERELLYIGQTNSLYKRLYTHANEKDFSYYNFIQISNLKERLLIESLFIFKYKPLLNKQKKSVREHLFSSTDTELNNLSFTENELREIYNWYLVTSEAYEMQAFERGIAKRIGLLIGEEPEKEYSFQNFEFDIKEIGSNE